MVDIFSALLNGAALYPFDLKSGKWSPDTTLPPECVKYGLDATDLVIDQLERLLWGENLIDYRAIHLLAEHKRGLFCRLKYVVDQYGLATEATEVVARYGELVKTF